MISFRFVALTLSKKTLSSLPLKVTLERQLLHPCKSILERGNVNVSKAYYFSTSRLCSLKDGKNFEHDSAENERLEKSRLDEYLSARKFSAQDTLSSESLQHLDIKSATQLYEGDVAQNRSFSEADLKAGRAMILSKLVQHWDLALLIQFTGVKTSISKKIKRMWFSSSWLMFFKLYYRQHLNNECLIETQITEQGSSCHHDLK